MSIKEIAQQHGLSVQAVYKKIKLAGIDLNTLKDGNTGRLTADGEKLILSLVESRKPLESHENSLKQEIEKLKLVNEQLLNEVERMKLVSEQQTNEIKRLEQNNDDLRNALTAAQILQRETLAKIPAALPAGEKKGFFSFLHRRKTE